MKTCSTCKEKKPLEDFNKHALTRDNRQSQCKQCNNQYSKRKKTCIKCKKKKPLKDFTKKDKYTTGTCKECTLIQGRDRKRKLKQEGLEYAKNKGFTCGCGLQYVNKDYIKNKMCKICREQKEFEKEVDLIKNNPRVKKYKNSGKKRRLPKDQWSFDNDKCIICGTNEKEHRGLGRCVMCYSRYWQKSKYGKKANKEYLKRRLKKKKARESAIPIINI